MKVKCVEKISKTVMELVFLMQCSLQGDKIFVAVLFCLLLTFGASPKHTQYEQDGLKTRIVFQASDWLKNQQDIKTSLFRSYDIPGDNRVWAYDQAIAIIALVEVGDVDTARRCADAMLQIRDTKHMAWSDGYDSVSLKVEAPPIAVGPNGWMGLALLNLHQATNDQKYLLAAEKIAEFILKQQVPTGVRAGSVECGYNEDGKPFEWTSTEHNADTVAFLAAMFKVTGREHYHKATILIAKWLDREMWNAKDRYYYPGYSDNKTHTVSKLPERLDSQTWTILALDAAAQATGDREFIRLMHDGLGWIDQYLCVVSYKGNKYFGYAKETFNGYTTKSVWAEGTAGYFLADRRIGHKNKNLKLITESLRNLQRGDGAVLHSVGKLPKDAIKQSKSDVLLVAHFEAHPNCLFGNVGVYGDGEPDLEVVRSGLAVPYSCYYEPKIRGYDKANTFTGEQSFRLVNAGIGCASDNKGWASLALDLGPEIKSTKKVKPVNVSKYQQLVFWAKTENRNAAKVEVLFRDSHAKSLLPQLSISPTPSKLNTSWQKYTVDLGKVGKKVDLKKLVHIGLGFGKNVGNDAGTIIYLDDICFEGTACKVDSIKEQIIFQHHQPYGNVAATGWLIFVELGLNPFMVKTSPGS